MDDFITGLLVGVFGEDIFIRFSRNTLFGPMLLIFFTIIVESIFLVLTLIFEISDLLTGNSEWTSFSGFFSDFLEFHFVLVQPYAALFSMVIALLGVLSYLYHRK